MILNYIIYSTLNVGNIYTFYFGVFNMDTSTLQMSYDQLLENANMGFVFVFKIVL